MYPLQRQVQEHSTMGNPRQELCGTHPTRRIEPMLRCRYAATRERTDPQDLDLVRLSLVLCGYVRVLMRVRSYPGLYQQTWYRTADDHLAIVGDSKPHLPRSSPLYRLIPFLAMTAVCMDVRREESNVLGNVQTWQCSGGNPQQVSLSPLLGRHPGGR
jgi:hypothetical protein